MNIVDRIAAMRILLASASLGLLVTLVGCATTVPSSIVMQPTTAKPQQATLAPAPNGAIFQVAAYRPLFEDHRARLVGDLLTITINEKTSAGKQAASSSSKTGSTDFSVPKLFGVPASTTNQFGISAKSANKLDDKGADTASNSFTGTLGVTVVEVLPNGNLVVSGEKQVAFDRGAEFVRFSGVVSPDTIASGNVVSSTQVADARVEYRTNSQIDNAEVMTLLTRFFLSFAPL